MRGLPDHLPSRHGIVDKFINKLAVLFNPSEWKQSTKMRLQRALVGLPLLLLVPLSFWILNPFPAVPWAKDMLQRGEVFVPRGGQNITVPIQKTFYGVRLLDEQSVFHSAPFRGPRPWRLASTDEQIRTGYPS